MTFEHPYHLVMRPRLPAERDAEPYANRWWALLPLSFAIMIIGFDATVIGIAAPNLSVDLGASDAGIQWVFDAFTVALAGFVLLGGGIADRYGRKGTFQLGCLILAFGSVGAAWATSVDALILARAVTGFGAALLVPPALSMIGVIFPSDERTKAVAIWSVIAGVGLALGPIIGGILLEEFWVGSVFLINVPVALAGLCGAAFLVPPSRRPDEAPLDVVGAALSVLGLGTLVFGFISAPEHGWGSPLTFAMITLGVVLTLAFTLWELKTTKPMVDVRVFRHPAVVGGGLAVMMVYFTFYSIQFIVPQYLQYIEGNSTLVTGLMMLPLGGVFVIFARYGGPLVDHFGVQKVFTSGYLLMIAGMVWLAFMREIGGYAYVLVGLTVYAFGWTIMMVPATTMVLNALPVEKQGDGSAVNMVTRQVGGALGIAIIGSVYSIAYRSSLSSATGDLTAEQADKAENSVADAESVAAGLSGDTSTNLQASVATAMENGAFYGFMIVAGLTLVAMVAGMIATRGREQVKTDEDAR